MINEINQKSLKEREDLELKITKLSTFLVELKRNCKK